MPHRDARGEDGPRVCSVDSRAGMESADGCDAWLDCRSTAGSCDETRFPFAAAGRCLNVPRGRIRNSVPAEVTLF